jgi:hypothetical protein
MVKPNRREEGGSDRSRRRPSDWPRGEVCSWIVYQILLPVIGTPGDGPTRCRLKRPGYEQA